MLKRVMLSVVIAGAFTRLNSVFWRRLKHDPAGDGCLWATPTDRLAPNTEATYSTARPIACITVQEITAGTTNDDTIIITNRPVS